MNDRNTVSRATYWVLSKIYGVIWRVVRAYVFALRVISSSKSQVSLVDEGCGGMFKFLVSRPGEVVLIKQWHPIMSLWCRINNIFPLGRTLQSHSSFSDVAEVLKIISNTDTLVCKTLLAYVDEKKMEYAQYYLEHATDSPAGYESVLESALDEFREYGLVSLDHFGRNYLISKEGRMYLIDLESFQKI